MLPVMVCLCLFCVFLEGWCVLGFVCLRAAFALLLRWCLRPDVFGGGLTGFVAQVGVLLSAVMVSRTSFTADVWCLGGFVRLVLHVSSVVCLWWAGWVGSCSVVDLWICHRADVAMLCCAWFR